MRYAVDAAKLCKLGWFQRTPFSEGLPLTIQWYRKFGESWWGDISHCLSAFPLVKADSEVDAESVAADDEIVKPAVVKSGYAKVATNAAGVASIVL